MNDKKDGSMNNRIMAFAKKSRKKGPRIRNEDHFGIPLSRAFDENAMREEIARTVREILSR